MSKQPKPTSSNHPKSSKPNSARSDSGLQPKKEDVQSVFAEGDNHLYTTLNGQKKAVGTTSQTVQNLISSFVPSSSTNEDFHSTRLENKVIFLDNGLAAQPKRNVTVAVTLTSDAQTLIGKTTSSSLQQQSLEEEKIQKQKRTKSSQSGDKEKKGPKLESKHSNKKKTLSRFEKKALNLLQIPKHGLRYADFLPMHDIWKQYLKTTLGDCKDVNQMSAKLVHCDLHGAHLEVYRSNCPGYTGKRGIVMEETQNTFVIIMDQHDPKQAAPTDGLPYDKVGTLPKKSCDFILSFETETGENQRAILIGKNYCMRPFDRLTRTPKAWQPIEPIVFSEAS
ncbi:putative ribonuclease P protein subunit p29 [Blattamonas nauphoetae]|uniref:Ribonuclease P protein subunit p29 n=1 Tax=Blattamonas nauphoetae TaxID=2049346 RepID=A0ABQ9Y104_9EUKA|nr:putative ribonuclease P protein subunit p29 [Blattamonas nauphoetae]